MAQLGRGATGSDAKWISTITELYQVAGIVDAFDMVVRRAGKVFFVQHEQRAINQNSSTW